MQKRIGPLVDVTAEGNMLYIMTFKGMGDTAKTYESLLTDPAINLTKFAGVLEGAILRVTGAMGKDGRVIVSIWQSQDAYEKQQMNLQKAAANLRLPEPEIISSPIAQLYVQTAIQSKLGIPPQSALVISRFTPVDAAVYKELASQIDIKTLDGLILYAGGPGENHRFNTIHIFGNQAAHNSFQTANKKVFDTYGVVSVDEPIIVNIDDYGLNDQIKL